MGRDRAEDQPYEIVISAENLHNMLVRQNGEGKTRWYLHDWVGRDDLEGNKSAQAIGLTHCRQVFGDKEFRITLKELLELKTSTQVCCTRAMRSPPPLSASGRN